MPSSPTVPPPPTLGMQIDAVIASLESISTPQLYGTVIAISLAFSFYLLNSGGGSSSPALQMMTNDTKEQQDADADSLRKPARAAATSSSSSSESSSVGGSSSPALQMMTNDTKEQQDADADSLRKPARAAATSSSSSSESSSEDRPEPRWHILRFTNYVAALGFLVSVLQFASNASAYLNDSNSLLQFLTVWSLFVVYFVGFFGISFVELDDFVDGAQISSSVARQRAQQQQQQQQQQQSQNMTVAASQAKTPGRKSHKTDGSDSPPIKVVNVHPPATSAPVCSDPKSFKKPSAASIPPNLKELPNSEIASLVLQDKIKDHQLEKLLDPHRAVQVRRLKFDARLSALGNGGALDELPHRHDLEYKRVLGANCEIVVGYVPIPVGMAGPVTLNGESVYIPMATTEGCLVASTNRGCKAISQGSGASSTILKDGITRAPCVRLPSAKEAAEVALWIETPENFATLKEAFESTTSFGKLLSARPTVAGKNVYVRLRCFSGDAMGMNMISKGSLAVIECLRRIFPALSLVALSGNMCTDKKAAAMNWIEGRGKSVVIEATIPADVVRSTLKTSVTAIVEANLNKNLIGSAMAGTVGGFNAHAANNVTAVFLATGQDPAQNVESSNCITLMEETPEGDLWMSCTMPSIEVGTVGGGTGLPAQAACLRAIGAKGGGENPGDNARRLAHVVAAATMAGELSLMAALASNSLVAAHMAHNRKPASK
eukprot:CAMPEP_0183784684 /NCGR_PEP_ID=MMETSP0739-20130205/66112_1 /TAXON_ID=385413 /ORGANISM="Thalassiosira miniscula, Strain CCMP1093" /LENGTH=718 /DNA_ID=CAMNT_0026028659 /DNA_START=67 /DNA_END=2223 /DNA_ORIENTATION=-